MTVDLMLKDINLEGVSLLFDLDGTLLDTLPTFVRICNLILKEAHQGEIPLEILSGSVSYGVKAMLKTSFGHYNQILSDAETERYTALFFEMYESDLVTGTKPYDGLEEYLKELYKTPVRMAVATNKTQNYANQLVQAFGWEKYFPVVLGPQGVTEKKPSPRHLWETVAALGTSVHTAIMIGDSDVDAQAALAAGMPFIFHAQGYKGDAPVQADNAFDHYDQFGTCLRKAVRSLK